MKKFILSAFTLILLFSFSTAAFASEASEPTSKAIQQALNSDAYDLEKLVEALNTGLEVSPSHPVDTYIFDDGSYIELRTDSNPVSSAKASLLAAGTNTGTVSLSGYSAVTGDNLLLYRYTMSEEYRSTGTKIDWYDPVPTTVFHSPIWSLWNLDSEAVGIATNPNDSNGIRVKSTIQLSFGIWELNPQHKSAELYINVKGNGTYTSSAWETS